MQRSIQFKNALRGSGCETRQALAGQRHSKSAVQRRSVITHAGQQQGGRQPWDLGRFVKTVMFFNPPPQPAQLLQGLLGNLLGGPQAQEQAQDDAIVVLSPGTAPASAQGVVLVAGATGGVGKRVVQQLLAAGRHVRALVRDVPKARSLLAELPVAAGGRLELVAADITQPRTLLPAMFSGVRAVVCCTAVKVAPKEGDTVDRAKYYQGIKFYDPEIVGDTPEAVELKGMQNLLAAVKDRLGTRAGIQVLVPGNAVQQWGALDDVVMGGVSESRLEVRQGAGEAGGPAAVFTGLVSTDNNGGFTSVRSRNFAPLLDCSAYEGLALRLRGDGQRYKCIIRTDTNWDSIAYCRSFDTVAGEWQTIQLPFSEFFPVFRAKTLKDGAPLDPSGIASVQLMLSKFEYDGQLNPSFTPGPFELPIESITTYLPQPVCPRFVHVSSAGVTRPNRPGINVDAEPPAVKLNDALGGLLTYKLAGEDALRASGLPYAIVRPCALTEEPAGAPLEIDQGDVIKGKISRDDVADLCIKLLELPQGTDTTFEIKSTIPFSQPWQVDPSSPPAARDWGAMLAAAGVRPGVTGRTINGVYTGKLPEGEALGVQQGVAA